MDEFATLYCGDCMEIMQQLPADSVDLVLTDPPYGIDFQSAWIKDKARRKPKIIGDKETQTAFISEVARVLKPTGAVCIFTRWDVQQKVIDEMTACGMKPRNVLIWDKVAHGMGDLKRAFGSRYESIVFYSANDFRFNGKRPTDIIKCTRVAASHLIHPNEKPIKLLEDLIEPCTIEGGWCWTALWAAAAPAWLARELAAVLSAWRKTCIISRSQRTGWKRNDHQRPALWRGHDIQACKPSAPR